jgi:cysteine desulfurase
MEPLPDSGPLRPDAVARRYLDAASTLPLHPAARETLAACLDQGFADPLRLHGFGRNARLLLDNAREVVATALAARPDEVTFTSSGTTAVHLGVLGLLLGRSRVSPRLVHSAVEHSAVFAAGAWWQRHFGGTSTVLPVDALGRVSYDGAVDVLREPVGVLAVQSANPEVGTVQPLPRLAEAADAVDVPLFVDFAASAGRLDLPGGWSAAAASAHKWGGPAGVGVLLVRKGSRWRAPFPTDDRVDPRVAGFENVPAALAAAAALQAVLAERDEVNARQVLLTTVIRSTVAQIADVDVVGDPDDRLPHVVTFSCLYLDGESLVTELDRLGFGVASGSACTASTLQPSHVLEAMGALTHGNVRVSLTRETTEADVDSFLLALPDLVDRLRGTATPTVRQ